MSSGSESARLVLEGKEGRPMNRQQLVAAERWLLTNEILSHLRHTVCNKLGSARNAAFFIRRSMQKSTVPTDPRFLTFFQLIDDELSAIGHQLASGFGELDNSWPRSRTRLSECIESALSIRAPPIGVSVSVQCSDEVALSLRAVELIVALCCLLDNAYESMAQAGQIGIFTNASADYITLSVIDSGCGFSTESAKHAFEAFYTTKSGHLGLGLNLVHRVLNDHGGRAVIDSAASGARVSVLLPQSLSKLDPHFPRRETT